jgi:hypothetical protein
MKHSDVFGSLYIMSPCCMAARGVGPANPANEKTLAEVRTLPTQPNCRSDCARS